MSPPSGRAALEAALHGEGRFLWGLCYRMTGSAADADDLVQETLARALERPPRDLAQPLQPWLTRVAVNLSRDKLRRRRRAGYVGPWLPSPIETPEAFEPPPAFEPVSTEGRYDLLESASLAFLLALEALSPKQRAVLLLRDVFEYSVREVADALGLGEGNVKMIHLRARGALTTYRERRGAPGAQARARHAEVLGRFLTALIAQDVAAVQAMLTADVVALSDGGGEFHAARVPVVGASKVAALMVRLLQLREPPEEVSVRPLNGLPAVVASYAHPPKGEAPLLTLHLELDAEGKISALHSVLATRKLTHLKERRREP